jgi:hypothetical protein
VWHPEEYEKLPEYDQPMPQQPMAVFGCHQQDGHLCAGWVGCHDMENNLALRISVAFEHMSEADYAATLDYESPVELWESGTEAALHGLADVNEPSQKARTIMKNLKRKGLGGGDDPRNLRASTGQRTAHPQEAPE